MKNKFLRNITDESFVALPRKVKGPVGIWCQNDVVSTSMQHHHVASTLIRRHFYVMCPLGDSLLRPTAVLPMNLWVFSSSRSRGRTKLEIIAGKVIRMKISQRATERCGNCQIWAPMRIGHVGLASIDRNNLMVLGCKANFTLAD